MVLLSRDSSNAVASSAAFVSVDESRCTIILAAAAKANTEGCVCVGERLNRRWKAHAYAGYRASIYSIIRTISCTTQKMCK